MTLEQFAYLADIIGVVLVIASLIYVAQQVRQNTDMIRAESRNAIFHSHQQDLYTVLENPEIMRGIAENQDLDEQHIRFACWLTAHFRIGEHEWFQRESGALDETAWQSYSSAFTIALSNERTRAWWNLMKQAYDKRFVEEVDHLVKHSDVGNLIEEAVLALGGEMGNSEIMPRDS